MADAPKPDETVDDDEPTAPRPEAYAAVRDSIAAGQAEVDRINAIIKEILTRKRTFKDYADTSLNPSYTNFKVPYPRVCLTRYKGRKKSLEMVMQDELHKLLIFQPTAYDAARFARHLAVTSLWPPLHNRVDIEQFKENFFYMPYKQTKRLDFLMKTKIV